MTWTDRHPHPGDPPPHPGAEPSVEKPDYMIRMTAWWSAQAGWNDYVRRERLHRIAGAVDALLARSQSATLLVNRLTDRFEPSLAKLHPYEEIALVIGVMHLDGSTVLSR